MIIPSVWSIIHPLFRAFVGDPLREWLCDRKVYRRWRGGVWYNVLPSPEHLLAGDRLGWRYEPAKEGDCLVEVERHFSF